MRIVGLGGGVGRTRFSTWIETVYNRRRRHCALGQISAITFEHQLTTAAVHAAYRCPRNGVNPTSQVTRNAWSAGLSVSGDGAGVVAHADSVATRLLADRTGLTQELSGAMPRRSFVPVHDRGQVLRDVAVMLADSGESISDIDVLRHQSGVLGSVASPPAVWRNLDPATRVHR